jgi:hypothetical protein
MTRATGKERQGRGRTDRARARAVTIVALVASPPMRRRRPAHAGAER